MKKQYVLKNRIDTPPANGLYYTVPEAAELLNVNTRTVQRRLIDGTLKGKKLSGVWKIYPEELQAKNRGNEKV